jgi:hypothetical protein
MKERLTDFLAIIGGGLVIVAAIGDFSTKTRAVSAGIGIAVLFAVYFLTRDNKQTP